MIIILKKMYYCQQMYLKRFIDACLKYYELDPCHCFSAPGLSQDAMLKMTDVKLEKISDINHYLFIEKGTRGGVSYIVKRYAKVNNKYISDYDSNKQQHSLLTWIKITYMAEK